jgi:DNA-binding CsgD family transcriptional regulator
MPSLEEDEAAILALIHRNRIAIWMRDFETWASCFVHAPYLARWGWWAHGGAFYRLGWDNISTRLRHEMAEYTEPHPRLAYETTVENLSIRIDRDMAWATYEQHYPGIPVQGYGDGPALVYEARVFERHDGEWKIAFLGMLDGPREVAADRLELLLDGEGRVLSSQARIDAVLADDDLVIRGGRLRVRDTRTDARLQAAIRWAAGLDNSHMPYEGTVPVVMEAAEGLPTKVWWIVARGARISFTLSNERATESRLDMAAAVYGLSPSQRRLAGLVTDGLTLGEIAAAMEITPNTARTHLQRVFEKTGVRNQTALVRVLLSAVAPV